MNKGLAKMFVTGKYKKGSTCQPVEHLLNSGSCIQEYTIQSFKILVQESISLPLFPSHRSPWVLPSVSRSLTTVTGAGPLSRGT